MAYYDDTIRVVVRITYGGQKAKRFFSKWTPTSEKVLREDLVSLGVPNPSKNNIELLKPGCVEFYWDTTWQNDTFLHTLEKRIQPKQHSELATVQAKTKKRLSIVGLKFDITSDDIESTKRHRSPSSDEYEDSEEEESSEHSPPYTQYFSALYPYASPPRAPSSPTPPVHPNKKQKLYHPPASPAPTSQPLDKQVAFEPLSKASSQPVASTSAPPAVLHPMPLVTLSSANADISKATPMPAKSQAVSAQKLQQTVSPPPSPSAPSTTATIQAISVLLPPPDSETSLPVESRPPTAPIILPPPSFFPRLPSAPSTPAIPLPTPPQTGGAPPMPQIPENITSSFMPPKRASQVTRSGITLLPTAHHIESLEEGEVISRASPNTYISSSSDKAEKTAAMVQVTQATPLLAPRVPPEVDIEALINNEPVRSEITELSRVEKIQKGLAFLQARSQAMVSELQRLGVATPNPERDRVMVLEEEVKKLRVALEDERKLVEDERKLVEDERRLVKDERRRREEAENALADVRRELREPFVVPALLDAFLTVSKLTTRVTSNAQER